jgi:hypothetical protein
MRRAVEQCERQVHSGKASSSSCRSTSREVGGRFSPTIDPTIDPTILEPHRPGFRSLFAPKGAQKVTTGIDFIEKFNNSGARANSVLKESRGIPKFGEL